MTDFHNYLIYDPFTGLLTWKDSPCVLKRVRGKTASSLHGQGYRVLNVAGKTYLAHRLIWFMIHGVWPKEDVDHINGDRSDNRIENLREASRLQNLQNSSGKPHSSRYKGVSWDKARGKWVAYCKVNGKVKNLGRFTNEEEAAMAYNDFAKRHFGEYARLNHPALTTEAIMVA